MRGFTLIEMFITMILLAIIIGLGVPSYTSFRDDQRLENVGQHLATDMQLARSEAAKDSSRTVTLYLFTGSSWCWRIADSACTACDSGCTLGSDKIVRGANAADYPGLGMTTQLTTANQLKIGSRRGVMTSNGTDWVRFTQNNRAVEVRVSATGNARLCTTSGTQLTGIESCS